MNSIWSDNVQGIQTLYLSRKLRFDDVFFEQYRIILYTVHYYLSLNTNY